MEEVSDDYIRLPLDERLQHKLWKARVSAYEEILKMVQSMTQSSVFKDHFDTARRVPAETNAVVLDAAYSMLLAFLQSCPPEMACKLRPHVLQPITEKGLIAGKTGTRAKAVSIISSLIAADTSPDTILSEVCACGKNAQKQPKLMAAVAQCLSEIAKLFGGQTISTPATTKNMLLFLNDCFQHSDKLVREEAQNLVVLMSRWNQNMFNGLSGLKPVQLKELGDAVALMQNEPKIEPTLWLRGQQPTVNLGTVENQNDSDVVMEEPRQQIDEFDSGVPINVLEKLPPNFAELAESSKWKERKEILETLLPILKVPKIEDGRYGELVSLLVKRIADVNVMVVVVAANCLEHLSRGLRSSFIPHRSEVVSALLDRCKEKKPSVVAALKEALSATIYCIASISDIMPELQTAAGPGAKNPQIKQEAFWFASFVLRKAPNKCAKKDLKDFCDLLVSGLDHSDSGVRDCACEAVAALMVSIGEKNVLPFVVERIDKTKMNKIKELMGRNDAVKCNTALPNNNSLSSANHTTNPVGSTSNSNSLPLKRPIESVKTAAKPPVAAMDIAQDDFEVRSSTGEGMAMESASNAFGEQLVAKLRSSVWKERLEAMDLICNSITIPSEQFAKFMSVCPGWKESNFQVFGKMLTALQSCGKLSREAVVLIIDGVTEKLSDAKLQKETQTLLLKCAESVSIGFLIHYILLNIQNQKNPKLLADACKFITMALYEFGTVSLKVVEIVNALKGTLAPSLLQNANPSVRSAAVQVAGTLFTFLGPSIRPMFADQPPVVVAALESEFTKSASNVVVPKRSLQTEVPSADINSGQPTQTTTREDSTDISGSLNNILLKISDSNWKIRKEALDELAILLANTGAGRAVLDQNLLVDFLGALKARFTDTNKNLSIQALELTGQFFQSLGNRQFTDRMIPICRSLLQTAMLSLADIKPQVRQAALKCLDDLVIVLPPSLFIGVAGGTLLATESPNLRKELIGWIGRPLSMTTLVYSDEETSVLFSALSLCLQDKSGEVRKSALSIVPLINPGELLIKHAQKNNPSLVSVIQPHIVTVKPPKTPVKSSKTASSKTPIRNERIGIFLDSITANSRQNIVKWPFDGQSGPRKELVELLEQQSTEVFTAAACHLLFSPDFREQIAGMSLLDRSFEEDPDESLVKLQSTIDILLRYLTVRLLDSNTAVWLKCLDVLEVVLSAMDTGNVRLSEADAQAFLPFFIHRLGDGGTQKQRLGLILKLLCRIYPASKLFNVLIDHGLKAKSNRTRIETLQELGLLLSRNGCSVITPAKHVPILCASAADRDAGVRSVALNVLVQLSRLFGSEIIYKQLTDGVISQKEIDLFEERLKRTDLTEIEDNFIADEVEANNYEPIQPPPTPLLHDINPFATNPDSNPNTNENNTPTIPTFKFSRNNPVNANHYSANSNLLTLTHHPLDTEIELISCSSDSHCIQSLQRLDEYLNNSEQHEVLLLERSDQLIMALAIRLRAIYMQSEEDDVRSRSRLCRYVCNALVLIVSNYSLDKVTEATLELLISTCLKAILSDIINNLFLEDKDQLLKALNVLLVKALEGCAQNTCYRVLFGLLLEAFAFDSNNSNLDKYPELVMKCLWKETKGLSEAVDKQLISIPQLLLDIDHFLKSIPPIEWKTRAAKKLPYEDLPLRTVKTIIHELTGKLACSIADHWDDLDADSFVISYCKQFLEASGLHLVASSAPPLATSNDSKLEQIVLEQKLKTICDCICSKPDTRMHGWYANDQIKSFIASLGPFFQKYIERGLSRIDAELSASKPAHPIHTLSVQEYKERLSVLKSQMFGNSLETENIPAEEGSPVRNRLESPAAKFARHGSTPGSPLTIKKQAEFQEATITSLRERLAKLKNNESC